MSLYYIGKTSRLPRIILCVSNYAPFILCFITDAREGLPEAAEPRRTFLLGLG